MIENNATFEDSMYENEPLLGNTLRARLEAEHERSKRIYKAGKKITDEPKPVLKEDDALTDDDFRTENAHIVRLLGRVAIPDPNELPRDLERIYQPGEKLCYVALAFTNSFYGQDNLESDRWDKFTATQSFMKRFIVDPQKLNLTHGFTDYPGYYFDHLPELVKKDVSEGGCTFSLNYPYPPGDFNNRVWFAQQIESVLRNLRIIMNQPLGTNGSGLAA